MIDLVDRQRALLHVELLAVYVPHKTKLCVSVV
jgi:hypothetical protein